MFFAMLKVVTRTKRGIVVGQGGPDTAGWFAGAKSGARFKWRLSCSALFVLPSLPPLQNQNTRIYKGLLAV